MTFQKGHPFYADINKTNFFKKGGIPWNKGLKVDREKCGEKELKAKDGRTLIELANKSGEYKRDISDWMILCKPCHVNYDKERRLLN